MRKVIISYQHEIQARQATRNQRNSQIHKRSYGRQLECAKCGAKLRVGDTAYKTSRSYLCQTCGEKAEINI